VRILLYGRLAETIDRHIELDAPRGWSIAELRRRIAADHPAAADSLERSRACIGNAVVGDDHILSAGDDVEFLPPVSGG
jgi:molybdopterin converting factor small subunit